MSIPKTPTAARLSQLNWRAVRAVAARDLKIIGRSKSVLLPIIIVPLLLLVIMPAALGLTAPLAAKSGGLNDLQTFLAMMPPVMKAQFASYNEAQVMVIFGLVYMFAPLFLILPMMTASVIAAGSFAGEKERHTLEALLYTPTTDAELMIGKVLSAWVPALLVSVIGFVAYGIVANASAWATMQRIFFPTPMWIVLILWLSPATAVMGLGAVVLISSKVSTFQDAQQISGMVVIPVVLLLLGQIGGVVYLSAGFVFLAGLVVWLIDAALLWFGVRTFRRTEIIARL